MAVQVKCFSLHLEGVGKPSLTQESEIMVRKRPVSHLRPTHCAFCAVEMVLGMRLSLENMCPVARQCAGKQGDPRV